MNELRKRDVSIHRNCVEIWLDDRTCMWIWNNNVLEIAKLSLDRFTVVYQRPA